MIQTALAPQTGRLDVVVTAAFPDLSRSRVAQWIREGRITVDGRVVDRPSAETAEGARLTLDPPAPPPSHVVAQDIPLPLVYVDDHVAVIDKPAGLVVHPAPGHPDGTLVNALRHHLGALSEVGGDDRPGLVHRLDKGTSGLLVVARTDLAHRRLAAQFADHSAGRTYLALVHGVPAASFGAVRSHLGRHPGDRLRQASVASGRPAVTHWRRLATGIQAALVECVLETGRTHQVRVHLLDLGHPILGDGLYARGRAVPSVVRERLDPSGDRPMLHATELRFTHPHSGEPCRFSAPPPADFRAAAAALGLTGPWETSPVEPSD